MPRQHYLRVERTTADTILPTGERLPTATSAVRQFITGLPDVLKAPPYNTSLHQLTGLFAFPTQNWNLVAVRSYRARWIVCHVYPTPPTAVTAKFRLLLCLFVLYVGRYQR